MARKPKNADIGTIKCPICGDDALVRRDCNGKLYYVGKAGMIKPNLPSGQNWMLDNATIWPLGKKPVNEPAPQITQEQPPATQPKVANVPVNESTVKKTLPAAQSKPVNEPAANDDPNAPQKPDFMKWLIG
ncbi:hypothetical protein G3R49_19695 [Shewanella sp. WXL01]|uniref:hypothetical protein n=1 Tax=Shewanella sp. WXL01 TaxID=2709721 RepID=UPI0014382DCE|nr:hypothetical protein [Shewanella sp. WXL01]NKF52784.1 hypothetical protein [Shewanella sp. WXL01]